MEKFMGIKFTDSKGSGTKPKLDQYEIKQGANAVRFFGDLLPRYIYWVPRTNGSNMPVENLSFDRVKENFSSSDKDWVKEYFPDAKSQWAYSIQCIDLADGRAKIFNLKKKIFDQIRQAAVELGDPSDLENGWEVHFTKTKTGPHVFNVEYTLDQIKCLKNQKPVTEAQRKVIEEALPIDELLARPSPDSIREFLDKITKGESEEGETNTDESISDEFDVK